MTPPLTADDLRNLPTGSRVTAGTYARTTPELYGFLQFRRRWAVTQEPLMWTRDEHGWMPYQGPRTLQDADYLTGLGPVELVFRAEPAPLPPCCCRTVASYDHAVFVTDPR